MSDKNEKKLNGTVIVTSVSYTHLGLYREQCWMNYTAMLTFTRCHLIWKECR